MTARNDSPESATLQLSASTPPRSAPAEPEFVIAPQNGKTKLTIRIRFNSFAIRDAMLEMGMTEGWSQSLERLAELLRGN